ncbi:hypothetical protein [Streptomyces sp. NPDC007100]|uniref:hypothetical protein n=1 Tax=Streptomyces sp. NPDC007100 TaxID=3155602 RepID=UPI00340F1B01
MTAHLRATATATTALLLASTLTGCATKDEGCGPAPSSRYDAADFLGDWSGEGAITLKDQGGKLGRTFMVHDWPKDTTTIPSSDARPSSGFIGNGGWTVSPDRTTLTLTFDRLDAALERSIIHTLQVGEEKNQPVLYARVGDPKTCHVFALKREGD